MLGVASPVVLAAGSLVLCAAYAAYTLFYRLFLHPLASFPGSKAAAASKWYDFYYDIIHGVGGQYSNKVSSMYDAYGPILRINPDEIHIRDPAFFNVLYTPAARRDKWPPAAQMKGIPLSTFGTTGHDLHRKRRTPNTLMFSRRAILECQGMLKEAARLLRRNLSSMCKTGEVRNLHSVLIAYTSDFYGRYLLGMQLDYQSDRKAAQFWEETAASIPEGTPLVKQFPWVVGWVLLLPRVIAKSISPHLGNLIAVHHYIRRLASNFVSSSHEIASETKKGDVPPTLFHAISRSSLPSEEKILDRMYQEGFNLFVASIDTTARTGAMAFYYLLNEPRYMQRLQDELRTVMPTADSWPDLQALEGLPFLTATVKETLRAMQMVTGRIPLVCPDNVKYQDWVIPAGTPISMTINDVMMDPAIFPDPMRFDPDRWLDENGKLHKRLDQYWAPFSRGPRICQGMDIAWANIYRSISGIARAFELELVDVNFQRDIMAVRDCFLGAPSPQSKGVRVRIKPHQT